jgi:glycosyltransferase involved in cell wall biosynthesis
MRILHLINHVEPFNGHVHVLVDLACGQADLSFPVCVASRGGKEFEPILEAHRVRHWRIDQTRRPLNLLRAVLELRRAIRVFQPDIIHAHMMTGAVLAALLRPFCSFKLITTVHNEFERPAILMGLGDRVVAVSGKGAASMERRGVSRKRLRVVLNGPLGSPRLEWPAPQAQPLARPAIVFVGALMHRKGVNDLIEAFRIVAPRIPAAQLHLLGWGPQKNDYIKQAAQAGLAERIVFCGTQCDPRPWMLGADVFVLPSLEEPGGLVLAEARGAGCAVIATDVGGNAEMLDNGSAGLLIPPQRPDLLAEAIFRLLDQPAELALWRKRAQQNIENFQVERVVRDYLAIYEDVLANSEITVSGSAADGSAR